MNEIKVAIRNIYGKLLVYPACKTSELLAELSGKKTFDKVALSCLKKLGYDIVNTTAYSLESAEEVEHGR